MKKTISIIALLMFTGMSGPSLADRNEGVRIQFTGGETKNKKKEQEQEAFISAKKERAKSLVQQSGRNGTSPAPSLNNY